MSPWFIKYKQFLENNQQKKAQNILLTELYKHSHDPLVYLESFSFFYKKKKIKILNFYFYNALFIFPSSILVKEVLTFIRIKFYSQSPKTYFILSEYIIPNITTADKRYTRVYYWISNFFYKRRVLDSALLYNQLYIFFSSKNYHYTAFLQQLKILIQYKNQKNLMDCLKEHFNLWMYKTPLNLRYIIYKKYTYLLPLFEDDTSTLVNKKEAYKNQEYIFVKLIKIIFLIFLVILFLFFTYSKVIGSTSHSM